MKTKFLINFLTFVIVLVGSFSLGPDRDFTYSQDSHSAIISQPSVDLGPLRISGGKTVAEFILFASDRIKIPLVSKISHLLKEPIFYLRTYSLVALREFHLLI